MPVTKVVDKSGRGIYLVPLHDFYASPEFNEEACWNMGDFPLRTDDVILVSYPKSGCHWAWEILRILATGQIVKDGLDKESYMMEWAPASSFQALPSPRVLNNHMPFGMQPRDLLTKKPKVVLFYRNFKDVAVSFFHHHKGILEYGYPGDDFSSYVHRLVDGLVESGNPFKFHREWEEGMKKHPDLPILYCAYEDMKEDPMREMRRISEFFGKQHDDAFLQQVCSLTSFDAMKSNPDKGLSKPVFYRKGQVGDWQNHFSEELNEWFSNLIKTEMAGTSFKFRYTLDK